MRAVRGEVGASVGTGDRFEALFRARYGELHGLCYRLLGDHAEAEDVVQETFLKLDGHPVLDRPDEEVAAWLRRVCLNATYNRLRGQRRAAARLDRAGRLERVDDEAGGGGGPLLDVLRAEQQRAVRRALANGVVMLALFGLAWLGGIIQFIGTVPPGNDLMANLGTAVSLLLPADAVWRGASYHLMPPSLLVASSFVSQGAPGLPFASTTPMAPAMLTWALAYPAACIGLAVAAFRRRDL